MLGRLTPSKVKAGTSPSQVLEALPCIDALRWVFFLGTLRDPGILPRALAATFHHIEGHQYEGMDLKPHLRNDVQYLAPDQVKQERSAKAAIFTSVKEVRQKP